MYKRITLINTQLSYKTGYSFERPTYDSVIGITSERFAQRRTVYRRANTAAQLAARHPQVNCPGRRASGGHQANLPAGRKPAGQFIQLSHAHGRPLPAPQCLCGTQPHPRTNPEINGLRPEVGVPAAMSSTRRRYNMSAIPLPMNAGKTSVTWHMSLISGPLGPSLFFLPKTKSSARLPSPVLNIENPACFTACCWKSAPRLLG